MDQNNPIMKTRSQALRKNATDEEKQLWYRYLKNYPIQWYRQRIIGNYIADFYCKKLKIVIELDGSQHYEETTMEYDRARTAYFQSQGIEVIRFTNTDIQKNLRGVCDYIDLKVAERKKQLL